MRANRVSKSSTLDVQCYARGMVGKNKRRPPFSGPSLTPHQIVAYNFRRAREEEGWTQSQTSAQLEPYLGYTLNQAGVSAIEKTFDSERRRNIDVAELVAFSRCFRRPLGWFFIPPPGMGSAKIDTPQSGAIDMHDRLPAAHLATLAVGTPRGWDAFLDRITEMLDTDGDEAWRAMLDAFDGVKTDRWETQINLRRRAAQQATLVRFAGHEDDVITSMAALLVELVKLTPLGFQKLRTTDPDEALRLLAEGDQLVRPLMKLAAERQKERNARLDGFDQLEPIDLLEALGKLEAEDP